MVQFDDNNHLLMRLEPVDRRHIILLPFPEAISSTNFGEEDKVAFMPELDWVDNDIQSTLAHPDW